MKMKRRILNTLIAIVLLLGFLISQTIISGHGYYTSSSTHAEKHTKSSSALTEKCRICDMQIHNNLLIQTPDAVSFALTETQTICFYKQSYSGIKLVKSSSRSPPVV
jgi:hypothetical protein